MVAGVIIQFLDDIAMVLILGTTDFCDSLNLLPDVVRPADKESLYWNRMRMSLSEKYFNRTKPTFQDYLDTYDGVGIDNYKTSSKVKITCKGVGNIALILEYYVLFS